MKKTNSVGLVFLSCLMTTGLVGCGNKTYEYALVTDVGNIDDQSFNQTSWEAVKDFAAANKKTSQYYRPTEDSTVARLASIEAAVNQGAKVIVCPGFLFEEAVFTAQKDYPDVKFVLIDGTPNIGYEQWGTEANTAAIVFQEEIAGYLAGYGAVKEGNRKLGFCGGMAVPSVQRFGSGYVQGINAAAVELNTEVNVNYYYAGAFEATPEATTKMESWYTAGMDTVFACGGKVYQAVMNSVSKNPNGSWIGVDTDQSKAPDVKESKTNILTSATKGLRESVTSALEAYLEGKWEEVGGKNWTLGLNSEFGPIAAKDYVGIPTEDGSWNFKTFTKEDLNTVLGKIKDGTNKVNGNVTAQPEVNEELCHVEYESAFIG